MYGPHARTLGAVQHEGNISCNEEELSGMKENAKKKEEHLYLVMSPAPFNQAITPISPFYICCYYFSRPQYTQFFFLLTTASQFFPIQKKTSNHLLHLVSTSTLILSSLSPLLSLRLLRYTMTQLRLTRHPPHLYNLQTIPQL